jgi:hypothetical protein
METAFKKTNLCIGVRYPNHGRPERERERDIAGLVNHVILKKAKTQLGAEHR